MRRHIILHSPSTEDAVRAVAQRCDAVRPHAYIVANDLVGLGRGAADLNAIARAVRRDDVAGGHRWCANPTYERAPDAAIAGVE